ncbi:MAG: helix-turn-helix domain-containing protein [Paraglaciecola sp.]|uniref:AraC family transcriptional regulator n=1 Tax=Paraglaciecola sp. TaxID=1920173 RepID=UPI0025917B1F|nr:AraC family transcriptional regulator [uncultured Paraglaciecola sp.]
MNFEVDSRHIEGLEELLKEYGYSFEDFHNLTGERPITKASLGDKVPFSTLANTLEKASIQLDPLFPYKLARVNPRMNFGEITYLLRHCSSLNEAIDLALQHRATYAKSHTWCKFNDSEHFTILMVYSALAKNAPAAWSFYIIASAFFALKTIMGENWKPAKISLRASLPESERYNSYFELFDCELQLNQPIDYLSFQSSLLSKQLSDTHHNRREVIKAKFEKLKHISDYTDYKEAVLASIHFLLPTGTVSFNNVAAAVGVPQKTLYRRLSLLDTSYQSLLDNVRRETFINLLTRDASMSHICWQLGFADSSILTRFSHKNYGMPPSKLKSHLLQS